MSEKWLVDSWVDYVSSTKIQSFYPTAVAKDVDLPLDKIFEYLLEDVKEGKLNLRWETRCPNLDCLYTASIENDYESKTFYFSCPQCGEDFEVTSELVYPIFDVNPNYKEFKKQEKKTRPLFSMLHQ